MMMTWIDWLVVALPLAVVIVIAMKTQRYMRGVSDFLAAGRSAGRYLVCNALAEAGGGAVGVVATFELLYKSGYSMGFWGTIGTVVGIVVYLSGYLIYRYRESRVLTMAQLMEIRYSRRFRIFTGGLSYISGIINYGIFPAVSARFFVYFCGLPQQIHLGSLTVPTFALVMLLLLSISLGFTLLGGQLTAMVTDCVAYLISSVIFVVIAGTLLYLFSWHDISQTLLNTKPGESLVNPFDASKVTDFNIWYALIGLLVYGIYGPMSWQGNQGFNCSAASPHEAKMGRIVGTWRGYSQGLMIGLLAICAYTYLNNPRYALGAHSVQQALNSIESDAIRGQMRVPVVLAHLLPVGIKGAFCAIMLFMMIACDSSYLHSWGSILVQDVLLPLRKTPLTPKQHIRWLRWSITFVALFAFFFSLLFSQTTYIFMFFAVSGAIYLAGAGSVIIGALYWKKGTTAGAWASMIVGAIVGGGGLVVQTTWQYWLAPILLRWFPNNSYLMQHGDKFPINGQWMLLASVGISIAVYIVTSLLTCRQDYDLDRLLHRGRYAMDDAGNPLPPVERPPRTWKSFLGINAQFTRVDAWLATMLFIWNMFWFSVFLVVTAWNLLSPWPNTLWANYWFVASVVVGFIVGLITTVWFMIGGITDLRRLFQALRSLQRNDHDDGTVVNSEIPVASHAANDERSADESMEMIPAQEQGG